MRRVATNVAIVLLSLAIALGTTEFALRLFNVAQYSLHDQILFYTLPAFSGDEETGVHYVQNATIREVAVYGDQIDYDVVQTTNNLGFYDNIDYRPTTDGRRNVVFIGDSFTAGSGGFSWVPQLREAALKKSNSNIFNLGVGSASVHHFGPLLDSFKKSIQFDEVNIIVIANDFFRPFWLPIQKEQSLWFCRTNGSTNDCSSNTPPLIYGTTLDETQNSILEKSRVIYRNRRGKGQNTTSIITGSRIYTVFCDGVADVFPGDAVERYCPHLKVRYLHRYTKNNTYNQALTALLELPRAYPNVKFRLLYFPEKGDASNGNYALDLEQDFSENAFEFVPLLGLCGFTRQDYYPNDGHLTKDGYGKLRDCVGRILGYE